MHTPFDDMANDDLDLVQTTRPATPVPTFTQPCTACRGRGRFISYAGRDVGECFKCHGTGFLTFKTSPHARAKTAARAVAKKHDAAARVQQAAQAWRTANPDDAAWIDAKASSFGFAGAMLEALTKWGTLTDGQQAAVTRLRLADADRAATRLAEQAIAKASAPSVDAAKLEAAFRAALTSGLKYPKIKMAGLVFKPAKATGKNPGAIYVTEQDTYLGKVLDGRFLKVRACSNDQESKITGVVNDPEAAAKAYGLATGVCCICSRELTDPVSIAAGIGPICADRFGW